MIKKERRPKERKEGNRLAAILPGRLSYFGTAGTKAGDFQAGTSWEKVEEEGMLQNEREMKSLFWAQERSC